MAKQYGGYLGGFSGRLGPAIGYLWNGRWCLRSRPTHVHNPRTEAQTAHRTLFKAEVQLAARLRWPVTLTLTALAREAGMTAFNLFVSMNQPCFALQEGRFAVDWSRLRLSAGPVAPVAVEAAERDADGRLGVTFEKNPLRAACSSQDLVYLYVHCPATGSGCLAAPVHRRTRHIEVLLPDAMAGQAVMLYLMVQERTGRWSETAVGECQPPATMFDNNEINYNDGQETVLFDRRSVGDGGRTPVGAALLGDRVHEPAAGEEPARRAFLHRARCGTGAENPLPDA